MCLCAAQDGRADVVANDAGDRVTPAVVGFRDTEQVDTASLRLELMELQGDLQIQSMIHL